MPQIFIKHNGPSQLYVWHITETLPQLKSILDYKNMSEVNKFTSIVHQKQYLAKQILLQNNRLIEKLDYLPTGKPVLSNGQYISISHSGMFVVVAVSSQPVGIDLEARNAKLLKISSRFKHPDDVIPVLSDEISRLQYLWTAKESVYKLAGIPGLNLKNDIRLTAFSKNNDTGMALLKNHQKIKLFFNKLPNNFLHCQAYFSIDFNPIMII